MLKTKYKQATHSHVNCDCWAALRVSLAGGSSINLTVIEFAVRMYKPIHRSYIAVLRCYNNIPVWLSVIHSMSLYYNTEEYSHTGVRSHGGNDQRARQACWRLNTTKPCIHLLDITTTDSSYRLAGSTYIHRGQINTPHCTPRRPWGGKPYTHTGSIHIQIHNHPIFDNYVHKVDHCCEPPMQWLYQQKWRWLIILQWLVS